MHKEQGVLGQIIKYLMVFILGFVACLAVRSTVAPADQCEVLYVSQDEIMELEKQRIESKPLDERQMFLGRVEEAVKLVSNLSEQYNTATTKVVYSSGVVKGNKVRSISKQVHTAIISSLTNKDEK